MGGTLELVNGDEEAVVSIGPVLLRVIVTLLFELAGTSLELGVANEYGAFSKVPVLLIVFVGLDKVVETVSGLGDDDELSGVLMLPVVLVVPAKVTDAILELGDRNEEAVALFRVVVLLIALVVPVNGVVVIVELWSREEEVGFVKVLSSTSVAELDDVTGNKVELASSLVGSER